MKVPYEIVERRTGDIEKVWADTTFANQELGWKAELGIEDMCRDAYLYQQNYIKENGTCPSTQEIAEEIGIAKSSISKTPFKTI